MAEPTAMVFSDLDDTFLTRSKRLPPENLEALSMLSGAGVPFVPCTGRTLSGIPDEILGHTSCRHAIACNGAIVWDARNGRALRTASLPAGLVLDVYRSVRELDVTFDLFVGGRVLAERSRFERMATCYGLDAGTLSMLRAIRTRVDATVPEILGMLDGRSVEKVTIYWADAQARNELRRRLAGFDMLSVTSSHARNFEFMAEGVSKGETMAWLAGELGVPLANVIAFGDSPNDASMLRLAGDGVAVANAEPTIIEAADHVCASCNDAGPGRYLAAMLGKTT